MENPSVDFFLQKLVAELEDVRKDRSELLYHNEILRKELQLKLDNKEVIETVEVQQLKAEVVDGSIFNVFSVFCICFGF